MQEQCHTETQQNQLEEVLQSQQQQHEQSSDSVHPWILGFRWKEKAYLSSSNALCRGASSSRWLVMTSFGEGGCCRCPAGCSCCFLCKDTCRSLTHTHDINKQII